MIRSFFPPLENWRPPQRNEQILLGLLSAMVGLAWLLLGLWSASPYSRYLAADAWGERSWLAEVSQVVPLGEVVLPVFFQTGLWLLMCVAMMLPTTLPLVVIWHRLVSRHRDRPWLQGLLIAGYLSVWGVFGLLIAGVDAGLHQRVQFQTWLTAHSWLLGASPFALAGLFQFSPLKDQCLEQCRSPLSFALAAWQRGRLRWQSWWLGVRHGLYCVGCCWALMLLMFGVGMGNLGWMLLLGAVMAAEKNLPWGRYLRQPLGIALLMAALAMGLIDPIPLLAL